MAAVQRRPDFGCPGLSPGVIGGRSFLFAKSAVQASQGWVRIGGAGCRRCALERQPLTIQQASSWRICLPGQPEALQVPGFQQLPVVPPATALAALLIVPLQRRRPATPDRGCGSQSSRRWEVTGSPSQNRCPPRSCPGVRGDDPHGPIPLASRLTWQNPPAARDAAGGSVRHRHAAGSLSMNRCRWSGLSAFKGRWAVRPLAGALHVLNRPDSIRVLGFASSSARLNGCAAAVEKKRGEGGGGEPASRRHPSAADHTVMFERLRLTRTSRAHVGSPHSGAPGLAGSLRPFCRRAGWRIDFRETAFARDASNVW